MRKKIELSEDEINLLIVCIYNSLRIINFHEMSDNGICVAIKKINDIGNLINRLKCVKESC